MNDKVSGCTLLFPKVVAIEVAIMSTVPSLAVISFFSSSMIEHVELYSPAFLGSKIFWKEHCARIH